MKLNYASINNDYNIYNKYSLTPNIIEHVETQSSEGQLQNIGVKTIIIKPLRPEYVPGVKRSNINDVSVWYLGHIDIFDTNGVNVMSLEDNNISIEVVDYNSNNYIKKGTIPSTILDSESITNLLKNDVNEQITYNGDKLDESNFIMCLNYPSVIKVNIPDNIDVSTIVLTPCLKEKNWKQMMDLRIELYNFNWTLHTSNKSNLHFFPTPFYSMTTPFYEENSYNGPGEGYGPYSIILSHDSSNTLNNILNNLFAKNYFKVNENGKYIEPLKDTNQTYRSIFKRVLPSENVVEEDDNKYAKNSWGENFKIFSDGKNELNDEQAKIMVLWFKTIAWLKRPNTENYYSQDFPQLEDITMDDLYNQINFNFEKLYNSNLPQNYNLPNDFSHQIYIFKNLKIDAYIDFMTFHSNSEIVNEDENLLANILKNDNANIVSDLKSNPVEYCKFLNIFQTDFDPCSIGNKKNESVPKEEEKSLENISKSLYNFFNLTTPNIEQEEKTNEISKDENISKNENLKTFGDIYDLYDLDKDGKLDKYEAKLFLATTSKKQIKFISNYLLKTNFLGIDLENIDKTSFVNSYNKLDISADEQYKLLSSKIDIYKDEKYKKINTLVKKTWTDVFDDLFDLDKNGRLNIYEGKLFLAVVTGKKVSELTINDLKNNFLRVNLTNINRSNFVTACNKLTNARGEKQSSTDSYNLLASKINTYHDPELQKSMTVVKTWENIFDEIFDFSSNDGKLDIYEAMLLLACSYDKPIKDINDSFLTSNYLNINLINLSKNKYVEESKKLKGKDGNLIDSTIIYYEFKSRVIKYHDINLKSDILSKSWEDVFKLYDLDSNGKLDKYEAKLFLATVLQKPVKEIEDSSLNSNFLKVNLENIKTDDFVKACDIINSTPKRSYDTLLPRIDVYHDKNYQIEVLTPVKTESPTLIEIEIDRYKININIFYLIIILYIPIAMILAAIHGKSN